MGEPGPSGMPSHHHSRNMPYRTTIMTAAIGKVNDTSVPMPASFRRVCR